MKKMIPILVVGILVLSGLGAVGVTNNVTVKTFEKNEIVAQSNVITETFKTFEIKEKNSEYLTLFLEGEPTYLLTPGSPILPKVVKSFELPLNAKNINIDVSVNNVKEFDVEKEISPAPQILPLTATGGVGEGDTVKNMKVYSSEELYPESWFEYKIGVGLNNNKERTVQIALPLYPVRYSPRLGKLYAAESADIKITYDLSDVDTTDAEDEYDMVIIAPRKFSLFLGKLVRHKNKNGIKTELVTTQAIYRNYKEGDKPLKIKKFIQNEIEKHNISYVLLVGGMLNRFHGNPREDQNFGVKWWHVPVRYHNFIDNPAHPLLSGSMYDPGVISDLYYADVYKWNDSAGEYEFEDWDSNGDGIIGAWNYQEIDPSVENDTIDMLPDVSVGRLCCRNIWEVRNVVNKIIRYEKTTYGKEWFNRMTVISGDGFMDMEDLDIQWDTSELPDGKYTIIGQSRVDNDAFGPADRITVTLDKTQATKLTFNHDDHHRINEYPGLPIAEISSVSDGDILGNTDEFIEPEENVAYGNNESGWANVEYKNEILHIRGKTYDPKPYGILTNMHVWIINEAGEIVFDAWRNDTGMVYEGEWITGNETLNGGGGALYYMPPEFERDIWWASNGMLSTEKKECQEDMVTALSQGSGFAFMSGHGSPNVWSDHYPGIPGNRQNGSLYGLFVFDFGPKGDMNIIPRMPMRRIKNKDKLPILLVGGCHNSQFNVTMIQGLLDRNNSKYSWTHGAPVPECFSWYMVKLPRTGAIASIGNTGLGYGSLGDMCTIEGLDGGICIEFFKQYGLDHEDPEGTAILGDIYYRTQSSYWHTYDMDFLDHAKSLTQWVLMGDPSLKIGGYPQ